MSELGHLQTWPHCRCWSALPSKADIGANGRQVRFGQYRTSRLYSIIGAAHLTRKARSLNQLVDRPPSTSLLGRRCHPAAEAGCLYRLLRPRLRQVEPLRDQGRLNPFSTTHQAFVQPVQGPKIVRVLTGPA